MIQIKKVWLLLPVLLLSACMGHYLPSAPFLIYPHTLAEIRLHKRLIQAGVKFIQLGDEVQIHIPMRQLFIRKTMRLNYQYRWTHLTEEQAVLNDIIYLLNHRVTQRGIHITAHLNNQSPLVARQKAIIAADYLSHHGLKSPLIHAGYPTEEISSAPPTAIKMLNKPDYIEISFRLLHAENID